MNEQTLFLIKPDGVAQGLTGKIIDRLSWPWLKIVALKMMRPYPQLMEQHYASLGEEWMRLIYEKALVRHRARSSGPFAFSDPLAYGQAIKADQQAYLASGPVVAMVLSGVQAVERVRKLMGSSEPVSAEPGSIRRDLFSDSFERADLESRSLRNGVHASDSVENAAKEIALWFATFEIMPAG